MKYPDFGLLENMDPGHKASIISDLELSFTDLYDTLDDARYNANTLEREIGLLLQGKDFQQEHRCRQGCNVCPS